MLDSLYETHGIVSSLASGSLSMSPVDCIDMQIPWCNGVLLWKVSVLWLGMTHTKSG